LGYLGAYLSFWEAKRGRCNLNSRLIGHINQIERFFFRGGEHCKLSGRLKGVCVLCNFTQLISAYRFSLL